MKLQLLSYMDGLKFKLFSGVNTFAVVKAFCYCVGLVCNYWTTFLYYNNMVVLICSVVDTQWCHSAVLKKRKMPRVAGNSHLCWLCIYNWADKTKYYQYLFYMTKVGKLVVLLIDQSQHGLKDISSAIKMTSHYPCPVIILSFEQWKKAGWTQNSIYMIPFPHGIKYLSYPSNYIDFWLHLEHYMLSKSYCMVNLNGLHFGDMWWICSTTVGDHLNKPHVTLFGQKVAVRSCPKKVYHFIFDVITTHNKEETNSVWETVHRLFNNYSPKARWLSGNIRGEYSPI